MRTATSTLLFLAFCLSASAQSSDSSSAESNKFRRFSVNIHCSPDYSFRTLKPTSYAGSSHIIEDRNNYERPMIGYTAGIGISYFLKEQFALQLGLSYSKMRYGTQETDPNIFALYNALNKSYGYLEVPVKAMVLLGKKKVRFLASAGLTSAFLLKQESVRTLTGYHAAVDHQFFNLFASASAGIDITLGRIGIQLEPTCNYGMLKTIKTPAIEHLWKAGLDVGISYAFNSSATQTHRTDHSSATPDHDFKKLAIGFHFSANYSYRTFEGANPDFFIAQGYNGYLIDDELPMMGLEAGVKILRYLRKGFALETGINYSRAGYAHVIPSQDTSDDPAVPYATKSVYNYLEIPLKANFILGSKKIRFIASAGLSPAFLASRKVILDVGTRATSTMHIPFNLFATAAAGIEFGLGERLAIQVQPVCRYGLFNTKDEGLSTKKFEHLWQAGIDTGITYKF